MRKGMIVRIIICLICVAGIIYCLSRILPELREYREAEETYDILEKQVVTVTEDTKEPENTGEAEEEGTAPWNENWWYEEISIDFDTLLQQNSDIVAWIRFDHQDQTPINYPVVHAQDDKTYLSRDIHGKTSKAGTLFFEAEIPEPLSDQYKKDILYGHLMKNGSMFASLKKYVKEDAFYENNPFFTVYRKGEALRYRIFSAFITKAGSEAYDYGFTESDEKYRDHLEYLVSHSRVHGEAPEEDHRILTLSTCAKSHSNERIVVTGELVDRKSTE